MGFAPAPREQDYWKRGDDLWGKSNFIRKTMSYDAYFEIKSSLCVDLDEMVHLFNLRCQLGACTGSHLWISLWMNPSFQQKPPESPSSAFTSSSTSSSSSTSFSSSTSSSSLASTSTSTSTSSLTLTSSSKNAKRNSWSTYYHVNPIDPTKTMAAITFRHQKSDGEKVINFFSNHYAGKKAVQKKQGYIPDVVHNYNHNMSYVDQMDAACLMHLYPH
ncbi:hypothetical protein QOT17_023873 [Balamuthia mandrillaris]